MTTSTVPRTVHVTRVLEAMERFGYTHDEDRDEYGLHYMLFSKGTTKIRVAFDKRGYFRQAGGSGGRWGGWVISVSRARRFSTSPKEGVDCLIDFTLPRLELD